MNKTREAWHLLAVRTHEIAKSHLMLLTQIHYDKKEEVWVDDELTQEVKRRSKGSDQSAAPRLVLASLLWDKFKDRGDLEHVVSLVTGFFAAHEHKWFEIVYIDEGDPNPRRYIIDPAPVGVVAPCLLIEPDSPFQLLYKRVG